MLRRGSAVARTLCATWCAPLSCTPCHSTPGSAQSEVTPPTRRQRVTVPPLPRHRGPRAPRPAREGSNAAEPGASTAFHPSRPRSALLPHLALQEHVARPRSWWAHGRTRWSRVPGIDRKSTRLNSSHVAISYAVFCLKKKTTDPMGDGL